MLSLMIMSGLFWACEKDDSSSSYDFALTDSEHKAVTEWNILVSGGNKSLSLEAPDAWTLQVEYLSGGEGWLIASPTSGKAGVTTLNLSVGRNASYTDERKANVKITCGSQTKTLAVTQSARDGVVVEPLQHELNYRDTVITVHVAANIGYEYQIIQSGDPWITEVTGRTVGVGIARRRSSLLRTTGRWSRLRLLKKDGHCRMSSTMRCMREPI